MSKYFLGLVAALCFQPFQALAGCDYGEIGYLYVSASCTQNQVSNPENLCEVRKGNATKNVFFYSNVIADNGSNNSFPSSQFFNKIKSQHHVTENGDESFCYPNRMEANDDLDRIKSDRSGDGYIIVKVHMRDS